MICRLFELHGHGDDIKLLAKDLVPLQGAGLQKCLAFSVDGSRFASGGVVSSNPPNEQLPLLIQGCTHYCS